jgi:hypothetical protein
MIHSKSFKSFKSEVHCTSLTKLLPFILYLSSIEKNYNIKNEPGKRKTEKC